MRRRIGPACRATSFCDAGRSKPSLRDSRPFGGQPSVETLGYSRLSLRGRQAAVFLCRQNGPGVQPCGLWAMTRYKKGGWKFQARLPLTPVFAERLAKHFHEAPPENANTRTMCASVNSNRL